MNDVNQIKLSRKLQEWSWKHCTNNTEQHVKIASVSSAGHWENGKFQEKFNKEKLA